MKDHGLKIGLSLPCTDCGELQTFEHIPECFEYAELTGETLAGVSQLHKEHPLWSEFEFFNFRNIISSALTCQLTSENQVIVQEYKKELRKLLAQAQACKAKCVSIDPDWENLCGNHERLQIFNDVFFRLFCKGCNSLHRLPFLLFVLYP